MDWRLERKQMTLFQEAHSNWPPFTGSFFLTSRKADAIGDIEKHGYLALLDRIRICDVRFMALAGAGGATLDAQVELPGGAAPAGCQS